MIIVLLSLHCIIAGRGLPSRGFCSLRGKCYSPNTVNANRLPFHYGWVIVATGMLCIFACLGLGRFALGMLLPSMSANLGLSYAEMGFISTGNFLGYLLSVLVSGLWAVRFGLRQLICVALIIAGSSMLLVSFADAFGGVLVLYFLTGIGSGATNVAVMAMVSLWFGPSLRGRAHGFIVIGSGFAIMLTGALIPHINEAVGTEGWRVSWKLLGALVSCVAALSYLLMRDTPREAGLLPAGTANNEASHHATVSADQAVSIYRMPRLYHLGAVYFLFGFTYAIYVTFIVTMLVSERGFSEGIAGTFWSWIGFLSLFSGPVFGSLSDRIGRRNTLMLVFVFQAAAYFLAGSDLARGFLWVSIGLFGLVAWSIPSIMAAAVADTVGPLRAGQAFGLVTFIFGLGQILGPSLAGLLAERSGSFSGSFLLAGGLAALAIALTAFLKRRTASSG